MSEQEIKYFIGCVPEYKINQLLLQLNEKEHFQTQSCASVLGDDVTSSGFFTDQISLQFEWYSKSL